MSTSCLLGSRHPDGCTATVVEVSFGCPPEQMLHVLRLIHIFAFHGETTLMAERLLTHGWLLVGIDLPTSRTAEVIFADTLGHTPLGLAYPDSPTPSQVRLDQPDQAGTARWLYLLDARDDTVVVYEATVHGRWARHSHHPLRLQRPEPLPATIAAAGDAATAHRSHQWRPATVSLDGWSGAWDAHICTVEYDRGVIVARLDTDTLTGVIADTDAWLRDRRPGSGLPALRLDGGRLTITWFAGTSHRQQHTLDRHPDGGFVLGPHVLPWILAGEDIIPGFSSRHLRNGTPPIVEWVTEAGLHAYHPGLAHLPLPAWAEAMRTLSGGLGVLAPADGVTGHHVWLLTDGHALLVTPTSYDPDSGTVTLPRPLAGSWTRDRPVRVFTADQLATYRRERPRI